MCSISWIVGEGGYELVFNRDEKWSRASSLDYSFETDHRVPGFCARDAQANGTWLVRHCIEHYDELLVAHAEKRVVRYHARPRNVEVETDSEVAVNRLRFIHNQLDRVGSEDDALKVSDGGIATPSPSSLSRELEFLISHTVHHFALITVIANKFQIEVPENFGIAPTTLKHRESN